uniref:DUF1592 domain-containing protein n=1 Tax=Schlesneria paludicola TaxID=360056 RepID=A0A7C2NZH7_9PLAN
MLVSVRCDACGRTFKVDGKYAGRQGRCPCVDCRQVYVVPQPESEGHPQELPPAQVKTARRVAAPLARKSASPVKTARRVKPRKTRGAPRWWIVGGGLALAVAVMLAIVPWLSPQTGQQAVALGPAVAQADDQPSQPTFASHAAPFVKKYCLDCHSGEEPEASISFARFNDERALLKDRKLWERALDLVTQGLMPPMDSAQPSAEEKEALVAYLNHALFHIDCSKAVDPGRVTIRRLNRAEYNNTIRDLVGVDFKPAADFPSDDVGYGFDNIGDVLSLPPLLMEKYVEAAETIARRALVVVDTLHPVVKSYEPGDLFKGPSAHDSGDTVAIISNGFVAADYDVPISGKYRFRVKASGQRAGDEPAKMELRIDEQMQKVFDVNSRRRGEEHEIEVQVAGGRHRFAAAFINDYYNAERKEDRNLYVHGIEIIGPVEIDPSSAPQFQRSFLAHRPSADVSVNSAVRENLRMFLKRAYRRPVAESEMDGYVTLVERQMAAGESFDSAMQTVLTAVLVSPHFLFRIETDRNPNDPKDTHPLNDFELATRLSYFLWASLPDDELFALAERNELHRDDVLETQIKRMLADPRSQSLVDNFAEQWLQLRVLDEITPDPEQFPEFSPELREDMKQETKRLFAHVIQQDLSVLDLLDADYTFVNERLAKHYGLPDVTGPEFRQVSVAGTPRAGLLTHASVMTMTSNPNRTSPVKRGKWIMEVVLNTPPPPPPPNVPELEAVKAADTATLREQLQLHRQNASCASCHRTMDDLGFGLENFDAIGRYRDTDRGQPIDTSGELPDGSRFSGPRELAAVLKGRQDQFGRCLSEKLLTYALGRGLEYYDRCTVNGIADSAKTQDYRFSALVTAIVKSEPFRMRRGEAAE